LLNARPGWAFNTCTSVRRQEAGSGRVPFGDGLPCPRRSAEKTHRQAAHWAISTRTVSVGENSSGQFSVKFLAGIVGRRIHLIPLSFTVLAFFRKTRLVDDTRKPGPSQLISDFVHLEIVGGLDRSRLRRRLAVRQRKD
jgi:hypothetical protein